MTLAPLGVHDRPVPTPAPVTIDKTSCRIVIFTRDNELGKKVMLGLCNAGFTNANDKSGAGPTLPRM
jgi:hypothetical protein